MLSGTVVFGMAGVLAAAHLHAQEQPAKGARAMYFAGLEGAQTEVKKPAAPAKKLPAAPKPPVSVPKPQPMPAQASRTAPPAKVPVVPAAHRSLGLRYTIVKINGLNSEEVAADTRFKSGDAVRLKIQANASGYLYLVHRGTSGAWSVLLPRAKDPEPMRVEAGKEYLYPETAFIRFRGEPGIEKLFVILSREPERSLDDVLFKVRDGAGGEPLLLAQNRVVADPLIAALRDSAGRDMVIEDAREEAAADKQDLAVYVVNGNSSSNARVVADIQFIHQ